MIMNFNTAPAAPAPAANAAPASAPAPAQITTLPGTPGYGSNAAGNGVAPSALPLFAQVLDVTGGQTADAAAGESSTAAPAKESDSDSQADSSLPAMAAPILGLPVAMLPPADAAAVEARASAQAQVQTQAQANVAQANPALNISLHPAAITLTAQATAQPAGRDTREPLAAANPATAAKSSAPAQPFESLLQQSAPAAPAVAAAPRDG
ncbi:hypothetical protein GCN75_14915, partial [Janthinobacterium violaceinigrum]